MGEMILRTALLCIGTVLAAPTTLLEPHLPQSIDCPNSDIHVYVNTTAVDRKEYTFVDWKAANLQDCVEKCFGNHFCYSIRYDEALGDANCALYYFAAYNCSNQALTKCSTIEYKGGSITLDCIRCPGRGDFVTAPPFSSVGEQTIVSETAVLARGKNIKGTATEITHNSEHDGKEHGATEGQENKDEQTDQVKKTEGEGKEGAGKTEIEGSGEAPAGTENKPATEGEKPTTTGEGAESSTEGTLSREGSEPGTGASGAEGAESTDGATESTSAAPGEGAEGSTEEGSTLSPTESGSTPSGSDRDAISGTIEGSGEEEEEATTTPSSGESNGEAESVTESSGEGSPSEEEGLSPASTAAAGGSTESPVEGSGIEGSGETPEIAHHEDEEPVNVDVETTTVWNGHTEQPRVCAGNLRFVPSSNVDLDTVQLLINSTKANSPAECAKICYEHNCGFAYYEPSTFACQYMANTEDMVDTATCPSDFKDAKFQAEYRTDVASTMTCVVCAKGTEISTNAPAMRPIASPRRGSYPACIISFQAAEGDHSSFPFYKSVQVKGLNACARHCFIGECSQSVYNPKTKECRLGSNPHDTCSNLPLIQKVPTPSQEVLMQCFRCIPEETLAAKGTVSETTGYREPPTAAESIDESGATANKDDKATTAETPTEATTEAATEETTAASATEAATAAASTEIAPTEETLTTSASEATTVAPTVTTAEAVSESSAAATTEAATEAATTEGVPEETTASASTESATETAATENAPEETTTTTATEASTEATTTESAAEETTMASSTEAATEAATTEGAPEETTTIAGTGDEITVGEALREGVTEAPEEEEITVATTEITTEATTTPLGGEEVEVEEASGEEATTVSGAEGETTTAADVEGSGLGREEITGADVEGELSKDRESSTPAGAAGAATTPSGEEETEGSGEGATTESTGEATTAGGAEGEATTAAGEEGATTSGGEGASTLSPEESATSEGPGEMSKAIEMNDRPLILASEDLDFGKSCVIKFQAAPFESRPATLTAPFEKSFPVDSIELCATRCFQDGCVGAKYEPESKMCHLSYDDKSVCDRTELHLRMAEVKGDTWIHCVNCYPEKSVVQDVLGGPLSKNTTGEEKPESGEGKSMLDKVVGAVSNVAHSVAETVTGESPDNVLHNGCIVNFQTSPSTEKTAEAVEYLPPFKTRYAHRCATKCFQEGCAAASFNPTTNECSLGYGRFVKCSNSPLVTTALELKETIVIHCMSCIHHKPGEGGVDLVVLSPDDARIHLSESQDVPSENVEGSGEAVVTPSTQTATTAAGESSTTGEGAEATTAESTGEGAETTLAGEEATTASAEGESTTGGTTASSEGDTATTVAAEADGGSLGEEGSGALEKEGHGRVAEIPLDDSGIEIPAGVNIGDVEKEKEEATGDKKEGGGKFKVGLPTGFSIDSGVGTMNKDGKATETAIDGIAVAPGGSTVAPEGTSAAPEGTSAAPEGTSVAPEGSTATAGDESSTESGAEVSSAAPEESTVASGESTSEPSSTVEGVSTGEEAATTAEPSEGASSTESATEVEPSTVAAEGSTTESSTDAGHGVIHPAKEFETSPLHPEESSTAKAEEGTTAEEGPAFVQATEDEEKEEAEKEEELITSDQKQREGLVEKALPTTPKTTETGTAAAKADKTTVASPEGTAEGADAEKTTVASSEGTVAPGESTTGAAESAEATTAAGEGAEGSTPSGAESTTGSSEDGAAAATTATPDVTTDLQHREGILEKALATASPTTKGEEGAEATTAASESSDLTTTSGSESTVAPTEEVVTSTEGTAATTEGNVGESTVSSKDGGKDVGGMAASIDETSKEEAKEVDEEMAKKGEVAQSGEKGASATSIDGFTTISPSESSTASFADETPTSTVPSPADLAKAIHREHGGAEFGQTGQRGSEETAGEEAAIKGEVKQSGEKGAAAASIDASSTAAPSEATTAADAASGEISTSSSVDGVGLAKGDNAESSTAGEISAESTSAPVETTSAEGAGTSEAVEESSTSLPSSIESFEASTSSSIDSSSTLSETTESSVEETGSTDHGLLIQKALATANPAATEKGLEVAPTTSVPSPADLAKAIHREHGGAEFGQTGQRGSEEAVTGAQEDEIKATTVSAAEATPAVTGESIDGGVDRALAAIGEQSKTTTEPPVQAVKDLLDALTSGDLDRTIIGKKVNGTEAGKLIKGTGAADGATPVNQKHDCSTGKLSFATFELVDLSTKFEVDAIAFSLPHCARLCYEVGCSMAAYSRFPRPLCLMHFETEDSHRCNAETNRTSYWTYASLQQVVAIDCIQCEGQTFFEHDHTVDITTLHAIDDSIVTVPSPQGISKNCEGGRLEFQFVPAGSLPRLNVTNDVPARTPADCARKCHEMKGCTTAGYIPTPSAEIANGVCLLTSDDEVCISKEDAVPQHASVTAFVISCIRCTRCSYTLSHMTLASSTAKFQHIATVTTIGECAEVCHGKKCTFAQYDATTNTCALSMEASLETGCNKVEPAVAVKGAYPVRLECVQCRD